MRRRAGGLLVAKTMLLEARAAFRQAVAPSERVRFGIIGIGMQGSGLLRDAISLPGVECVAAADFMTGGIRWPREITGNPNLPTTRHYQELLDRKDIDCIVAAVPDHWHKRVVVDACNAGKDIYCEKPMSHTMAEGFEMVAAAQKNNRIVQIGSQRVSSVLCAKARELYHEGAIGDVEMVELTLGRNDPTGAWEYPPPLDLSPQNLDWDTWLNDAPKIPFDPNALCPLALLEGIRHRRRRRSDGPPDQRHAVHAGLERSRLGRPRRWAAFSAGKTAATCRTCNGAVRLSWHSGLRAAGPGHRNARTGALHGTERDSGCDGEFELRHSPQTGDGYCAQLLLRQLPGEDARRIREAVAGGARPARPARSRSHEDMVYQGHDWDDMRPHLWNFFQAVKSRKPVTEDAVFGNHAAIACHMANESYFRKKPVTWDAASKTIKSKFRKRRRKHAS